jgi:hypothetical protein
VSAVAEAKVVCAMAFGSVQVYTTDYCYYCRVAKSLRMSRAFPTKINIQDAQREMLVERLNGRCADSSTANTSAGTMNARVVKSAA